MVKHNGKKEVAVILLLSILFSTTVLKVDGNLQFDDTQESVYSKAIECVTALGLMEGYQDQKFQPESSILRAEYVKIIITLMGLADVIPQSTTTSFDDVDDSHWASGHIEYSYQAGVISGLGNGLFGPDDEITYVQAIKILVDVLGYGIQARALGGYPTGYIIVASDMNLMRDISANVEHVATRGGIAQMVYNALEVDILEQRTFGETLYFYAVKGENILAKNNIYRVNGQITANSKTSLIGEASIGDNAIIIDNISYIINAEDAKKYLGYYVTAYYKRDSSSDENTVIYLHEQAGRNNTLKLVSHEIESVTRNSRMESIVEYYKMNSRLQTAKVSSTADVIFNEKALMSYESSDLKPAIGEISLLDSDNDGTFDIVFVVSYIVYIVDNISVDLGRISDKNGKSTLNLLDTDIETSMFCDGAPIAINDIHADDVLLVAESKVQSGKKVRTIIVSKDKVNGIVSQIDTDGITINNKSYNVSEYYEAAVSTDSFGNLVYSDKGNINFSVGDEGLFGLDIYGEVVYAKFRLSSGKHRGYIIDGSIASGLDGGISLKLITQDGEIATYKLASKFTMDGVKNFTTKELLNKDYKFISKTDTSEIISNPLFTENGLERQLIVFELNGDLEIRSIDTKAYCIDEDEDSLQVSAPLWSMKYNNAGGKLWCSPSGGFVVDAEAKVFVVEPNDSISENERGYTVRGKEFFANKVWYNCEIYNAGEEKITDLIVAKASTSIHVTTSLFVVQRISQAINDDGNITTNIYGLEKGLQVSKICAETMLPGSADGDILEVGDIIRCLTNSLNEVVYIDLIYDADGNNEYSESSSNFETNPLFILGRVFTKAKNVITVSGVTIDTGEIDQSKAQPYSLTPSVIYLNEVQANKTVISVGSAADIEVGDDVFLRLYDSRLDDVIVFKGGK